MCCSAGQVSDRVDGGSDHAGNPRFPQKLPDAERLVDVMAAAVNGCPEGVGTTSGTSAEAGPRESATLWQL